MEVLWEQQSLLTQSSSTVSLALGKGETVFTCPRLTGILRLHINNKDTCGNYRAFIGQMDAGVSAGKCL